MTQRVSEDAPRRAAPGGERRQKESRRLFWEAFFAVLAVHALLLGLFRFAPRENPPEADELPAVGSIDLNARGNAALVQWLAIHDPALLTAPNREVGYSAVIGPVRFHHPVADLPQPPLLNAPEEVSAAERPPLPAPPPGRLFRVSGAGGGASALPAAGGAVTWNGRVWRAPEEALRREFASVPGRAAPDRESVFELGPPRAEGLAMRFVLTGSCGDAELDRAAARLLRRQLESLAPRTGLVAVDWRRLAERGGGVQ